MASGQFLDPARRGAVWPVLARAVPVLAVFALALGAFAAGVDVSDRPGIPQAGWATRVYYAVGLFVLGGMDLGVPHGGPWWAREALWTAYFLAPLITTAAVGEGVLRMLRPQWLTRRQLHGHIVVAGLGKAGLACVDAAREHAPDRRVVVVDVDANNPRVDAVLRRHGALFFHGDIAGDVSRALALDRAAGVLLMTGQDLVNLEVAWRISAEHPKARIVAHVSDIGMRRRVGQLMACRTGRGPEVFNAHRVAAAHLYETSLSERFDSTPVRDTIVIAGFGRFGQTILEFLQNNADEKFGGVVLLDNAADLRTAQFDDTVGFSGNHPRSVVNADLRDPRAWASLPLPPSEAPPVVVLCSDDDETNLTAAISVRQQYPDATLYARVVHPSGFVKDLASEHRVVVLAVETLVGRALYDKIGEWFA